MTKINFLEGTAYTNFCLYEMYCNSRFTPRCCCCLCLKWKDEMTKFVHGNIIYMNSSVSQVNVFGFGATKAGKWHHYFDRTLTLYVNESHAGDFEYQVIRRLELEKRIVMFKGWTWTKMIWKRNIMMLHWNIRIPDIVSFQHDNAQLVQIHKLFFKGGLS